MHWVTPLVTKKIPEASSYKYLGIILRSDLNLVDQVNYTAQKVLEGTSLCNACSQKKKGNRYTKSLAYTSYVRPVPEYWSACCMSMQRTDKCVRPGTEESG